MAPARRRRVVKRAARVPRLGSARKHTNTHIVNIIATTIVTVHKKVTIIYIITPVLNISIKIPKVIIAIAIRKSLLRLSIYLVQKTSSLNQRAPPIMIITTKPITKNNRPPKNIAVKMLRAIIIYHIRELQRFLSDHEVQLRSLGKTLLQWGFLLHRQGTNFHDG